MTNDYQGLNEVYSYILSEPEVAKWLDSQTVEGSTSGKTLWQQLVEDVKAIFKKLNPDAPKSLLDEFAEVMDNSLGS